MTSHVLLVGETESGKTFYANQMHRRFSGVSVFWNHQHTPNIWGAKCKTPARFPRAMVEGGKKVNYLPPSDREEAQSHLQDVVDTLFDAAKRSSSRTGWPWCQLIVDEAPVYDRGSNKMDPLEQVATRGLNRHGIRVVAITQYPAKLKPTTRDQMPAKVVFRTGDNGRMAMRNYGWPADEIEAWTHGAKWRYCSYSPGKGWSKHEPIDPR